MGDIANQIINGECCKECLILFNEPKGFEASCIDCGPEEEPETKVISRVNCPLCGKRIKSIGLLNHLDMAHPSRLNSAIRAMLSALEKDNA